ncbi:hypothetical protein [Nostoc sp. NMS8]|uniref:hypothetical protein n=1 Tax=Nostoc sp. NMS8 TaxID=2815392 RepID=UPI0025F27971|nr:hypothetical protein [Nostoc sp. NMS8]MBN3960257.1 hypothetical protein [Nostoc sp. NMS8]
MSLQVSLSKYQCFLILRRSPDKDEILGQLPEDFAVKIAEIKQRWRSFSISAPTRFYRSRFAQICWYLAWRRPKVVPSISGCNPLKSESQRYVLLLPSIGFR